MHLFGFSREVLPKENNMKITYDPYADAMYIFAGKIFKSASTISVQPDVLVDLDKTKWLSG